MRDDGLGNLVARIAVTDEQTGLHTFAHFQQVLEHEIARDERYGHDLTLVVVRVDARLDFSTPERIREGDRFLRAFAKTVASTVRNVDHVARRGVEEFAVALLETDAEKAVSFIERLRRKLAETALPGRETGDVVVHFGSSTAPVDAEEPKLLIAYAEKALTRATLGQNGAYCAFDFDADHVRRPGRRVH
jgi:diguanylate cyclase (GGDEF)-like protein